MPLTPCIFVNFVCKSCGSFTLRVCAKEKHVPKQCFHCNRKAEALFACLGSTSEKLPSSTKLTKVATEKHAGFSAWRKLDGSQAKHRKAYGVERGVRV